MKIGHIHNEDCWQQDLKCALAYIEGLHAVMGEMQDERIHWNAALTQMREEIHRARASERVAREELAAVQQARLAL